MEEVIRQSSSKDSVSKEFKRQVRKWDAASIIGEIAAEIVKVVEADEGFKTFIAEEEAKHDRQKEVTEIEPAIVAK